MTAAPEPHALYRIRGEAGLLLYIGISRDFGRRWWEHARKQSWWGEMRSLSADEWYDSRDEARAAERAAIKAEKPKHNKQHAKVRALPPPRKASLRQSRRPRRVLVKPAGWMTMTEAATKAACSRSALYSAEAKGYLQVRRLPGRRTLIHEDQLRQWVSAHKRPKGALLSARQAEFLLDIYLGHRVYDCSHYIPTTRVLARLGLIDPDGPSGHTLTAEGKKVARNLAEAEASQVIAA